MELCFAEKRGTWRGGAGDEEAGFSARQTSSGPGLSAPCMGLLKSYLHRCKGL